MRNKKMFLFMMVILLVIVLAGCNGDPPADTSILEIIESIF